MDIGERPIGRSFLLAATTHRVVMVAGCHDPVCIFSTLEVEWNAKATTSDGTRAYRQKVETQINMVDRAEYKRRQAPRGVRIAPRAFDKDRRLPIANHYHHDEP